MKRLVLFLTLVTANVLFAQTPTLPSGWGTSENPYKIASLDNLYWIAYQTNHNAVSFSGTYFLQTADIDASVTTNWFSDGYGGYKGWDPIGSSESGSTQFSGLYDGHGYIISRIYINRVTPSGLFGEISGASISSLGVTAANIRGGELGGSNNVGGITGLASGSSSIHNCFITGSILGGQGVGGIVGQNEGGSTISNCYSRASVRAGDRWGGGLVGVNNGIIENCYSTGSVCSSAAGGLVGVNSGSATASFWDTETSGQTTSPVGIGKTTAEMKTKSTFDADWDFSTIWQMNGSNYPELRVFCYTFSVDEFEAVNNATDITETFVRFQNGNGAAGDYSVTSSPSLTVYRWIFGLADNLGQMPVVFPCPDGPIVLFSKNEILANGGTVTVKMTSTSSQNIVFSGVWSSASKYVVTRGSATDVGGTMDVVAGEDIPIIAQLSYADGKPIRTPGKTVTWGSSNGGEFSSGTSVTDANGMATVTFTTSTLAGANDVVTATDSDDFTGSSGVIHTIAGPPARLAVNTAIQRPIAGKPFDVTIQLQDKYYNPVKFSAGGVLTLTLYRGSGGGSLGGTLSADVQDGSTTTTISGVTYSAAAKSDVELMVTGSGSADGLWGISNDFGVDATLTVTATNGTVAKDPDQVSYICSEIVHLTATPAAGYQFANWSGDATGSTNPIDVNMDANKSVTANFASIPSYTVTLSSNPSAGGTTSGGGTFNSGSSVTVTATPSAGYTFANWTEGGTVVSTGASYAFTIGANRTLVANFAINTYTLTISATNGSVAKDPDLASYNSGTIVTLKATAAIGYTFTGWTGDASGSTNPVGVTMDGNKTVTANFVINTYTLTYTAGANGNITGTTPQTVNYDADGTQVTAVPNTGWSFTGWSDGVTTAARTDVKVHANLSVTANFAINTYTLTISATNGSVAKNPDKDSYNYGSEVILTATAAPGYTFTGWSGDATGPTTSLTVTMDANKNITANFAVNANPIAQAYSSVIDYVGSLPDNAFKKPAGQRRSQLLDMFAQSQSKYTAGNSKAAAQYLSQNVTNHLTPQGKNSQDVWVTDEKARLTLLSKLNDLLDLLQRPQLLGTQSANGSLAAMVEDIPTEYGLSQNYPNPFNPSTIISYSIPKAANVSLRVFNSLGQEVAALVDEQRSPGYYQVQWNANVTSGIYFYRLQAGEFLVTKKMVLLH